MLAPLALTLATVCRIVSCGVLTARGALALDAEAGAGLGARKPSFSVAGFCAPTLCHAGVDLVVLGCGLVSATGVAPRAGCDCCIRLRSFCDSFGAGRAKAAGPSTKAARLSARPCDKLEVLLEAACAMMLLMSVFGALKGVRLHGWPALGGVLPAINGDRGVEEEGTGVCGPSFGEGRARPRESNQTSSDGLVAYASPARVPAIGLIDGDCSGDCNAELPSSSMLNIMSLVDALALSLGDADASMFDDLRRDFIWAVGDVTSSPSDPGVKASNPAYFARSETASILARLLRSIVAARSGCRSWRSSSALPLFAKGIEASWFSLTT